MAKSRINKLRDEITSRARAEVRGNIIALIERADGSREYFYTNNLVTNQGDRYYAATAVGTAATNASTTDFKANNFLRLGTSAIAPTKTYTDVGSAVPSGSVALSATYPVIFGNTFDTDNTGGSVNTVSWGYSFGTGIANASNIAEGAVTGLSTGGGTCLTHFTFAATFNKTSADTLKVFVNHQMSGT